MKIGIIRIKNDSLNLSRTLDCININFRVISREQTNDGDFIYVASHDEFENVEDVNQIPDYEIWFTNNLDNVSVDRIVKSNRTEWHEYNKFDSLLKQFKNAKELYNTSPEFHASITMLMKGLSTYEVIEQLCVSVDNIREAQKQLILRAKIL